MAKMVASTKRRQLMIHFGVYALADFLAFSALNFTISIQSSINIKDGLGTNALAATFVTSIFFGLLSTPVFLLKLGPKRGLMASQFMMTLFIASNYYPTYFTMIPAAVMLGFSEGTIWPSIVLMNVYFGSKYAKEKKRPDMSQHFVNLFSGYFFTVHHLNQIFGGLTGYFILYDSNNPDGNNTAAQNTSSNLSADSFEFCGSRDCQDSSKVDDVITNYSPDNNQQLIILISCFLAMNAAALILNGFFVPNPLSLPRETATKEEELIRVDQDLKKPNSTDESVADDRRKQNSTKEMKSFPQMIRRSVHQLRKQIMEPKQILILPITFYHGLLTTFILAELPRAYVSCINGYALISIYSCVFGIAHVSAIIVGRFTRKIGRNRILLSATIMDAANLVFCLLWHPNGESSWMIFISYFLFGMTDGIWQLCVNRSNLRGVLSREP